ncbi:MAG: hypothetical protein N2C12_07470 [Planctomycetales bacterium]
MRCAVGFAVLFLSLLTEPVAGQIPGSLPGPPESIATPAPNPGVRSFRLWPRSDPNAVNAQFFPSPDGSESIAVVTGGINIAVEGLDQLGTIDISTDRLVAWIGGGAQLDLSGGNTLDENTPLELYLEGNVEFRQGDRLVQASRVYYNVRANTGLILDAELLTPVPEYHGKIRIQAEEMRQLARDRFSAKNAKSTTSRMGEPGYWLESGNILFQDRPTTVIDPVTGQPMVEHVRTMTGEKNRVYIEGLPIFFWPRWSGDLENPSYYLTGVRVGDDDVFGVQVNTDWDAYQLLGISKPPPASEWELSLDMLTDRGPGGGTTFKYGRGFHPLMTDDTKGLFDAWFIKDSGLDNLGLGRRTLQPERDFRGRVLLDHQQRFGDGFQLIGEFGLISDRNFLDQYFEKEWDTRPDELTRVRLQSEAANRMWSVQGSTRLNNFFTQTEWLPRGDHWWIGQSLLWDRLTWFEHSQAGYAKYRVTSTPVNPVDAAQFALLPWEVSQSGERLVTRQEIDLPLWLGPVKVVPYMLGELAHWGKDLTGNDISRAYGQVGMRSSLAMWTANPFIENELLNIHGLAHKVVFDAEFSYTDASQNASAFPLYDPLNDDNLDNFLNRLQSPPLGGPFLGPVLTRFDPRSYLVRSGLGGWVNSPSTEIVDDLTVIRLAARQRWQTKRGCPGCRRITDWLVFDTGLSLFPKQSENFGEYVGLINYDLRWHVGDRLTLLSDGIFDVFGMGQSLVDVGAYLNRPQVGGIYLGFRSFGGPISSQVALANINYRMSPKYIASYMASIDISGDSNVGQRLALTRIGESFLVRTGFNYDRSQDNFGVSMAVEPRLFRRAGRNRIEGIEVPPAGAFGID